MGLDVPLIHVTYAPGSNIGNLHWIWQSTATSIDDALHTTQPIIEQLKKVIPVFHTRAMRREVFEMFDSIYQKVCALTFVQGISRRQLSLH